MEKIKKAINDSPAMRWGILILVGFVLSVNYYFYDAFSTLKDQLTTNFGFSNTDYGLFSSIYSFSNTFLLMAVIGGIILDKIALDQVRFSVSDGEPEDALLAIPFGTYAAGIKSGIAIAGEVVAPLQAGGSALQFGGEQFRGVRRAECN